MNFSQALEQLYKNYNDVNQIFIRRKIPKLKATLNLYFCKKEGFLRITNGNFYSDESLPYVPNIFDFKEDWEIFTI